MVPDLDNELGHRGDRVAAFRACTPKTVPKEMIGSPGRKEVRGAEESVLVPEPATD